MTLRDSPGVGVGLDTQGQMSKGPNSCLTHPPVRLLCPRVAGHIFPENPLRGFG